MSGKSCNFAAQKWNHMENKSLVAQPKDEMVIYQTEDGTIKIDVSI